MYHVYAHLCTETRMTLTNEIILGPLDQKEALRYLGYGKNEPDEKVQSLIEECEKEILEAARAKVAYRVFEIEERDEGIALKGTALVMPGDSIKEHLEGCEKAVLMGVTVSAEIDRVIRTAQVMDMAKAVILDSLASVAVEQACDRFEQMLKEELPQYSQTWRFGIGYGDLPLDIQGAFLQVINAPKTIGLCVNRSNMLTPGKSVTAVIGLSRNEISRTKRGCQSCNLKGSCKFRKEGGHCNV